MTRNARPGIVAGATLLTAAILSMLIAPAAFAVDGDPADAPTSVASAPATDDPATDAQATDAPAPDAPAPDASATDAPTTDASAPALPDADAPDAGTDDSNAADSGSADAPADPPQVKSLFALPAQQGFTNTPPVASDTGVIIEENASLTAGAGFLLANATDVDGDPLTVATTSSAMHGDFDANPDGSVFYVPTPGFIGDDAIDYTVSDGSAESNVATLTIHVVFTAGVQHKPAAADDEYAVTAGTPLIVPAGGVLTNDSDPDGDAISAGIFFPTHHGSLVLAPSGGFVYSPNAGYLGLDSFTYRASDATGDSNVAMVKLDVGVPVGTTLIAVDDNYSTVKDTLLTVAAPGVTANDTVDGLPFAVDLVFVPTPPAHGSLMYNSDGSFSYQPDAGFVGTDIWQYGTGDDNFFTNVATVTITVTDPVSGGGQGGGGQGGGQGGGGIPSTVPPTGDPGCRNVAGVPISCPPSELTTLAHTGIGSPAPYLTSAVILGLAGTIVLVASSVRRRSAAR